MTTLSARDERGHRVRVRTLGLADTPQRALMAKAYDVYATACAVATACHNDWRRVRRLYADPVAGGGFSYARADDVAVVKKALKKATKAALYRADAKAQYQQARRAAEVAGRKAA